MLQGNSGCQCNYWHPGHKYMAHFEIRILNNVGTPVAVVSAPFQICEGSKVVEAF